MGMQFTKQCPISNQHIKCIDNQFNSFVEKVSIREKVKDIREELN